MVNIVTGILAVQETCLELETTHYKHRGRLFEGGPDFRLERVIISVFTFWGGKCRTGGKQVSLPEKGGTNWSSIPAILFCFPKIFKSLCRISMQRPGVKTLHMVKCLGRHSSFIFGREGGGFMGGAYNIFTTSKGSLLITNLFTNISSIIMAYFPPLQGRMRLLIFVL